MSNDLNKIDINEDGIDLQQILLQTKTDCANEDYPMVIPIYIPSDVEIKSVAISLTYSTSITDASAISANDPYHNLQHTVLNINGEKELNLFGNISNGHYLTQWIHKGWNKITIIPDQWCKIQADIIVKVVGKNIYNNSAKSSKDGGAAISWDNSNTVNLNECGLIIFNEKGTTITTSTPQGDKITKHRHTISIPPIGKAFKQELLTKIYDIEDIRTLTKEKENDVVRNSIESIVLDVLKRVLK